MKLSCCLWLDSIVKLLTADESKDFRSSVVKVTRNSEMVTIDSAVALHID